MKYLGHILGAGLFFALCVALFFQLGDRSIDGDQALSFFFAGGKGELFYQEILEKPGVLEVPIKNLKKYVNPSWFDNPLVTFQILSQSGETHPPLYYEALRLWLGWTPEISLKMARLLSLFFAIMASVFAGLWSKELTEKSLYFWPGALFTLSNYHVIEQSGLIRMHTTTLFFMAVFTWSSFRLLKKETGRDLIIHHASLLFGLCSTFFFSLYAAPFVAYRICNSSQTFKAVKQYLLSQSVFILWMSFYGVSQLLNLPYEDFSGLPANAHGKALEGWDFRAYSDLFIYLSPVQSPHSGHKPAFWLIYALVFGLSFWLYKQQKKAFLYFFFAPFVMVFIGEYFFDSVASKWANGRALNFFLFPLLMIFILSLNKIEKYWKYAGPLLAFFIIGVGFTRNYRAYQQFISRTPELIEQRALKEVKNQKIKDDDLVILMNRWSPKILKTTLYFRSYPNADVFIFEKLSDLSSLKLDLYRDVLVISNPEIFKGDRELLEAYFKDKGYQLEEKHRRPSDHLSSKDFALIFSYSP